MIELNYTTMKTIEYYTPNIEQVYIGLECELCCDIHTKEKCWFEHTIDLTSFIELYGNKNTSFAIRIKYLDIDDLRQLGFTANINVRKNLMMGENLDIGLILIYNTSTHKGELSLDDVLFKGTIRSKSELSRILNLIN